MRAHLDLQGGEPAGVMLPIHWGTFNLAPHPWAEPGEGTVAAAAARRRPPALPRPGEPFEPAAESIPSELWWRAAATSSAQGWATSARHGRQPRGGAHRLTPTRPWAPVGPRPRRHTRRGRVRLHAEGSYRSGNESGMNSGQVCQLPPARAPLTTTVCAR